MNTHPSDNFKPFDATLPRIEHAGDTWRVMSTGDVRDDGAVFAQLASTTRGHQQRNGWYPVQACDWIPADALHA